jgi:hypothetical protein
VESLTKLISALAHILWPILGFTILFLFKKELSEALRRLKKGKMFGQELELSDSLAELRASAEAAKDVISALPVIEDAADSDRVPDIDNEVAQILDEASRSPRTALITLASHIERAARRALASVGLLQGREAIPISQAVQELHRQYGGLPGDVIGSMKLFSDIRNRIIHGRDASDEDVISALDSGLTILRTLKALPSEINIVLYPGVPVYSDAKCTSEISDVKGIILDSSGPGGLKKFRRIFPTTRTYFAKGQRVSWEWDFSRRWGEAWYVDPESGQQLQAWGGAMEFAGRPLEAI